MCVCVTYCFGDQEEEGKGNKAGKAVTGFGLDEL